ncbi:MAG: hypothetical protein H3C39_00910 [Flavobacteriia bacterium]|nr:hypothetical protein [Flavobacteriia bacterium]
MKSLLLFFFTIFGIYSLGQQRQYTGTVLDSIGNPVDKAEICRVNNSNFSKSNCVNSDRWGKYRIQLNTGNLISIEIKYDSIPNVLKYYEYREDPFDETASLTEIERVKDIKSWPDQTDSLGFSENYRIEKKSVNKFQPSKVEIIGDSARLYTDYDYVKGELGFDLNFSYSISEHLKTPDLQNRFVQGRPDNGAYTHFGPPEAFSWGPDISSVNGLTGYNPNRIFQKGNNFKTGLNAAYKKGSNFFNFNFLNQTEDGLFRPIKSNSNQFKFNFNFPAWGGVMKTNASFTMNKDEMPLAANNYMNVLYAAWNSPFHFDTSQILNNGQQNTASQMYNNPEFLLKYNRDLRKESQINLGADYSVKLENWTVGGNLSYNYFNQKFNYGQIPMMSQLIEPEFFKRDFSQHFVNLKLHSELKDYSLPVSLYFDWIHQYESIQLDKTRFSNYTSPENFPGGGQSFKMYDAQKQRYTSVLSGRIEYNANLDALELTDNLTQSLIYTNTNQQSFGYQLNNRLLVQSYDYLIRAVDFSFELNNEVNFSEPELVSRNLNFNSLNQDLSDFLLYTEPYELLLNSNLKNMRESRNTEVALKVEIENIFSVRMSYFYEKVNNAFAPVYKNNEFVWENVADYHQQGFDITLEKGYWFLRSQNFNWDFKLNFHSYKNKTDNILNGQDRVPFFGFNEISKNYIEGQPVGVIVGSDYLRNENGQVIIDDNGFPIVDDNLKVIADPNPDFSMNWFNSLKVHNFLLTFNFEWQKGGQIWNGTQNTLNYFGRSQLTGDLRDVTGYVFDGVNTSGQPNTVPVDFSNPANDLSENRWVRYGLNGVASDAVESASYLRLQHLSLSYQTKLRKYHYSPITQLTVGVFAQNLWVSSKYSGVFPGNGLLGNPAGIGLDYYNFPLTRVYGISLNLKF